MRARRGLLVFTTAALCLGILLICIGSSFRYTLLSPGELTFKHGTAALQDCTACHALPEGEPVALLQAALEPHKGILQNQLCLSCHELGETAAKAHGIAPEKMARLKLETHPATERAPLVLAAARGSLSVPETAEGDLVCARCHREHQGSRFNLSFMDNQRCQACHSQQFSSLAQGHPEFTKYPYYRRPALFFDHQSHIGRHFKDVRASSPEIPTPDNCADCHSPAPGGGMMLVRDFSRVCASCHLPQILDTSLGGVRFLNLPGVDMQTLRRQEEITSWVEPLTLLNCLPFQQPAPATAFAVLVRDKRIVVQPPFDVGEWPSMAAGLPTPFLQLLLSADPECAAAQSALKGIDLRDLRRATPVQLKSAATLLWGVKELFYDLVQNGDQALTRRIKQVAGESVSTEQLTFLTGDLPPTAIVASQQRWLPHLLTEVPAYRSARNQAAIPFESPIQPGPRQPSSERWRRDENDCSIQYLPRRHSDLFLHNWLDLTGERYAFTAQFASVFDVLASPYQAGQCARCHGVEAHLDGSRTVEWYAASPTPNVHSFTTFAHEPHFSLLGGHQCDACHTFRANSQFQESFLKPDQAINTDPKHFESDFHPMSKAQCASCHTAAKAGDNCLVCHNYHIGLFPPFKAPLQDLSGAPNRSTKFDHSNRK